LIPVQPILAFSCASAENDPATMLIVNSINRMDAFLRPIITPNEICFRDLVWVYSLPIAHLQLEHRDCDLDPFRSITSK
jgi:hypothetical protein